MKKPFAAHNVRPGAPVFGLLSVRPAATAQGAKARKLGVIGLATALRRRQNMQKPARKQGRYAQ